MTATQRGAQSLLVLCGALLVVILGSVYADNGPDRLPGDAKALVATAGVGLGVLVIVLATAGVSSGERWAWLALWIVPVFFAVHVALLGTLIPDGVLAVLSVVALVVIRQRYGEPS